MLKSLASVVFVLSILTPTSFAQIHDLATSNEGSMLLFDSNLKLAGSIEGPQSKVFLWKNTFSVVYSPPYIDPVLPSGGAVGTVMSGDGTTYGYTVPPSCHSPGCIPCSALTYSHNGRVVTGCGIPKVSSNGRYALFGGPLGGPGIYRLDFAIADRGDFITPERPQVAEGGTAFGLTDSGDVLVKTDTGLRLLAPGQTGPVISNAAEIATAAVSANGSRVLYTSRHDGVIELRDGSTVIASTADKPTQNQPTTGFRIYLSNDGSRALILELSDFTTARASWMDLNTRERHDLGAIRDLAATISGDGRSVWLFQPDGYLARIRIDTGERMAIGEQLPLVVPGNNLARVRGSLHRINGTGFRVNPDWHITISNSSGSLQVPVLETTDTHIDYQIPWTLPATLAFASIGLGRTGGTFEIVSFLSGTDTVLPQFWTDLDTPKVGNDPVIKVVHRDFTRLVTPDDPARPGEVVHVYMTGLGPIVPAQADFTPAPSIPPAQAAYPLTCSFNTLNTGILTPARVLFAGLAAGMVGVNQVELEIPQTWQDPVVLSCRMESADFGVRSAFGYLPLAR
jgi:uncharacterized protein (TIGR03437 family)